MTMTLKPTNLLHLCDDLHEKIGREIKCIRIEKDAKKRKTFLNSYIIYFDIRTTRDAIRLIPVEIAVMACNSILKNRLEAEIHEHMHTSNMIHNGPLFFVKAVEVFYAQIKEKIQFYYIRDEVKCRKFFKECIDRYEPEEWVYDDPTSDWIEDWINS